LVFSVPLLLLFTWFFLNNFAFASSEKSAFQAEGGFEVLS